MGLREWRVSAGLTQQELANLAIVSRGSVANVEQGRYAPSAGLAGKICRAFSKALGVTVHTWDVWPDDFTPLNLGGKLLTLMQHEQEHYGERLGRAKNIF